MLRVTEFWTIQADHSPIQRATDHGCHEMLGREVDVIDLDLAATDTFLKAAFDDDYEARATEIMQQPR